MTAKAPNILIVMADQMAPAFLPIYGHPLVRAPNMLNARARRNRVRQRLLRESFMRALARLVHGWPPAVAHPRLRQRGRVRRRHPDLRAWPARARLSHHSLRQDALLRSRSAAWLRAAADDRHLSRRFQLDAGLGSPGASSELVSQHELGPGRRLMRALEPARLRRRSRLHGGARHLRHRAVARSAAFPHGRLVLPSARPVRRASALLGPLSRRGHRHAGAWRSRSIPIRSACATFARWTRSR